MNRNGLCAVFCLMGLVVRSAPIQVDPGSGGKAGFTLINPTASGVWFTNRLQGNAYATNAVAHNGVGVAIGDVDGDERPDIYLCNLEGPNRLYRNLGQWRFEEMELGEAACPGQFSTGATFADVDGDGDLDLLVNGIASGTRLFVNDGKGHLTESKDSGLSRTASATSLALADIDGDGDLDLYCTHYIDEMHLFDPTTRFSIMKRGDRWVVLKVNDQPTTVPRLKDRFEALPDGKVRELPEMDGLYRNDGKGHFTAIQSQPGVFLDEEGKPMPPPRDWGLAAMFRDINGDGAPDLYVCNDNVSPDRIWINSGHGTFRAIDPFSFRHTSRSSMGVDFGDVDRDGHDDLIVVDMLAREHEKRMTQLVKDSPDLNDRERRDTRTQYNRNMLFFGRPDGSFVEAALMAGVASTDWSWCPILLDVDLDGFEDLLVSNGFESDVMDQDSKDALRSPKRFTLRELKRPMELYPRWRTPNIAFRNRRDGTFEPVSQEWGFDRNGISYGMALGDLDNDGDLDVVVNNLNDVASVYRNDATAGRIGVRLKGLPPNIEGIGARIRLLGAAITQSQEMICGGRYASGDQAMRVFAADRDASRSMRLEVKWRNRTESTVTGVVANCIYEIDQASAVERSEAVSQKPTTKPLFQDVSSLLEHVHVENAFDDWAGQPSLPRRLSRLGPGVSWFDANGDGWEDLIVTSGRGGKLAMYTNDQGRSFGRLEEANLAAADQGGVLGWAGKGARKLLVAVSNYELQPDQESEIAVYSVTNLGAPLRLAGGKASIGPMALADIDGDSDLDLFVGSRVAPYRYPEPVSSTIWLNEHGELKLSGSTSKPFESVGLVSGATFADFDGDGDPDLALAIEWGTVRVFRNDGGRFEDMTARWGFAGRVGWWTSVTSGDFDGDGRLDLAAGNWGRNTVYELYRPVSLNAGENETARLRAFYGDWNSDGRLELIEAWYRKTNWFPVHHRGWFGTAMPELATQFATHEAFGKATVSDILGARYDAAKIVEVTELQSGMFLNRGSGFDFLPLPREAQLAPVLSINVGDFDADGVEDLFLGQNFYGTSTSELSRDDNGRGLWLRGVGSGAFIAIDASLTDIKVYGEQRGAALADFNHDGCVDLCVSQNSGPTKLYVNQGVKRGLRVTLRGPTDNPDAVGAQMCVVYDGGHRGPCRSIQAGSGYWSQDACAQVLGLSQEPTGLRIRWPGGKEQTIRIEKNVFDMTVNFDEALQ